MHLTNYSVNKKNPEYIFNRDDENDFIGHKRSFSSILNWLKDKNYNIDKFIKDIHKIINLTFCSV